jgi:hypothetical protein
MVYKIKNAKLTFRAFGQTQFITCKINKNQTAKKNQHLSFQRTDYENSFNTLKEQFLYNVFENIYSIFLCRKRYIFNFTKFVGINALFIFFQ